MDRLNIFKEVRYLLERANFQVTVIPGLNFYCLVVYYNKLWLRGIGIKMETGCREVNYFSIYKISMKIFCFICILITLKP